MQDTVSEIGLWPWTVIRRNGITFAQGYKCPNCGCIRVEMSCPCTKISESDTGSKTLKEPMPCNCGLCRGGRKSVLQEEKETQELLEVSDADAEGVLPQS